MAAMGFLRKRSISSALLLPLLKTRAVERNHNFYYSSSSTKKERASDSDSNTLRAFICYYPKKSDGQKAGSHSPRPSIKLFTSREDFVFDTSSSTEKEGDDNILRVIDSKIISMDKILKIPDSFLLQFRNDSPFETEYDGEKKTISLAREYWDETIQGKIDFTDIGNFVPGNENNEEVWCPLDLSVSKKKKNGNFLKFGCSICYPDGNITINSVSLKNSDSNEDHGWILEDWALNESLQKHFNKYLEIRGIHPTTNLFLFRYVWCRDRRLREHLTCLKKFKQFLEA